MRYDPYNSFSKLLEIHMVQNIKSDTIIHKCHDIFSIFGWPRIFVTDNGPSFVSREFQDFLRNYGICSKLTATYNHSTNGQAEKFVQTLKDSLNKMCIQVKDVKTALFQMLTQYNLMPHICTGKTPSELVFNRKVNCKFDLLKPKKITVKTYNLDDSIRNFSVNDRVSCRNYLGKPKWIYGRISKRLGKLHYLIKLDNGKICKRHVNQILKIGENVENRQSNEKEEYYSPPEKQLENLDKDIPLIDSLPNCQDQVVDKKPEEEKMKLRDKSLRKLPNKLLNDFVVQIPKKKSRKQ